MAAAVVPVALQAAEVGMGATALADHTLLLTPPPVMLQFILQVEVPAVLEAAAEMGVVPEQLDSLALLEMEVIPELAVTVEIPALAQPVLIILQQAHQILGLDHLPQLVGPEKKAATLLLLLIMGQHLILQVVQTMLLQLVRVLPAAVI